MSSVLDLDQLRNVTMDDEELMRELLSTLIADTGKQILLLERAVASADVQQCLRVAHYLKGACASVGAAAMASELQEIEHSAAQQDFAICGARVRAISEQLDKLRHEAAALQR